MKDLEIECFEPINEVDENKVNEIMRASTMGL